MLDTGFAASETERCIECGVDLELQQRTEYSYTRETNVIEGLQDISNCTEDASCDVISGL